MKALKKFLREFILTKKIYARLANEKQKKVIRETLQLNGQATMSTVQKVLEGTGARFFFDMGTLLGIIREGRLLSHDLDMDIALYINDMESIERLRGALRSKGAFLRYSYSVDGIGTVEDSFVMNGVKFDINYYVNDGDLDVCYLLFKDPEKTYCADEMSVVKLTCPCVLETKKINFMGADISVPVNAEQYLANRYGPNWKIPDKKYVYWKGPSTSLTDYVGRISIGA